MKHLVYILVPALMLVMSSFSGCERKTSKFPIIVSNVNATIIEGCFEYETADTFSIKLDEYPSGIISVYPETPIPDSLRTDGLRVVVSGNILEYATGNQCLADPNVKLAAEHKFIITNIKKIN